MSSKNALDHLILFLPADPTTNLPKIPSFISENFTLTPGGFHADGLTSNTLILLSDGSYIELISFLPTASPTQLPHHWWSHSLQHPGWADWCLTNALPPTTNHQSIKSSHQPPLSGSRHRADGTTVQWAVTFPLGPNGGQQSRGRVPFFCHDVTPRAARVPLGDASTRHASGVMGVLSLTVIVADETLLSATSQLYAGLFAAGPAPLGNGDALAFEAGRVVPVSLLDDVGGAKVILRVARDESEKARVAERGFWYGDVVLGAKADAGAGKEAGRRERVDEGEGVGGLWVEYV